MPPTPTRALLLLSCSARKRSDSGLLPADQRYTGVAFSVWHKARRSYPILNEHVRLLIISAEFGLLLPTTPIPFYNRKMDQDQAHILTPAISAALEALLAEDSYGFANLGRLYYQTLAHAPRWTAAVASGRIQLAAGGIGQRLAQQKAWLRMIALA